MEKFSAIYQRAADRKGGEKHLESLVSKPLSRSEIANTPDDRWLAGFTMKVFQCGISWQVVTKKWPNFESLFFDFKVESLLMLSQEQWEEKAKDPAIIRHLPKVMSIPANALMIQSAKLKHGSFGNMVAEWPDDKITDLWLYLKNHGCRLGGNTGPYTLRQMGVDTFIFSSDVDSYLRNNGIIDSGRNTKRAMQSATNAFIEWQQQSGRSFSEISQIIAFSCGENRL